MTPLTYPNSGFTSWPNLCSLVPYYREWVMLETIFLEMIYIINLDSETKNIRMLGCTSFSSLPALLTSAYFHSSYICLMESKTRLLYIVPYIPTLKILRTQNWYIYPSIHNPTLVALLIYNQISSLILFRLKWITGSILQDHLIQTVEYLFILYIYVCVW